MPLFWIKKTGRLLKGQGSQKTCLDKPIEPRGITRSRLKLKWPRKQGAALHAGFGVKGFFCFWWNYRIWGKEVKT